MNAKYGDIVVTIAEAEAADQFALGLRGHRVGMFSRVERGTRREDGGFDVTVENLAANLAAEDAEVRNREPNDGES